MNEPGSGLEKTLEKLLRRIVREEIRAALGEDERKTQNVKPYFTIKEAADFSRLAPSTIRLYIRQRKLPARKKFRTLRGLLGLSQTKLAKELGVTRALWQDGSAANILSRDSRNWRFATCFENR